MPQQNNAQTRAPKVGPHRHVLPVHPAVFLDDICPTATATTPHSGGSVFHKMWHGGPKRPKRPSVTHRHFEWCSAHCAGTVLLLDWSGLLFLLLLFG
jgi:hypothetical protein